MSCELSVHLQESFSHSSLTVSPAVSSAGSTPSPSSKKPRSRGLFSGLFCCLRGDQPELPPVNNNAPLLVEENGTVSKVCFHPAKMDQRRGIGDFSQKCMFCVVIVPGEAAATSSQVKRCWEDLCGYRPGRDVGSQLLQGEPGGEGGVGLPVDPTQHLMVPGSEPVERWQHDFS